MQKNQNFVVNERYSNVNLTLAARQQFAAATIETALKLAEKVKKEGKRTVSSCITGVKVGLCVNNHHFMKPVFCGKEDCDFCGQDKSPAHNQRISAVIDQVQSWRAVSYLVFGVPEIGWGFLQNKENLNKYRTFIRRKLKRDGFNVGLMRWHYAGDCKQCNNKKGYKEKCEACNGTGCGDRWQPHLNVLLPAGNTQRTTKKGKVKEAVSCYEFGQYSLKKEYLEGWRIAIKDWFQENFKIDAPEGNLWHTFISGTDKLKKQKIFHKVRYILRATLRNKNLSVYMSPMLKHYKNTAKIGIWQKPIKQVKNCPCCGSSIVWVSEPSHVFFSNAIRKKIEVQAGMFLIIYNDQ